MRLRKLAAAVASAMFLAGSANAAEQFIPVAAYWTGPYAAGGSALGDGMADYYEFLNERDGGINGVRLTYERCETAYKTDRIVKCYEKLKNKGPTGAPFFHPFSTGGTYALFEQAQEDRIPIISIGLGRTDASDGRVFPYLFPALTNYWSQSTAKIKFIGQLAGGMEKLKGLRIANLHHDSAYGKETIPVLEVQARKIRFRSTQLWWRTRAWTRASAADRSAVQAGLCDSAWLGRDVSDCPEGSGACALSRQSDRGCLVVGIPKEDTRPAGEASEGYYAAGFHAAGTDFPVIQEMIREFYSRGKGAWIRHDVGTIYANRAVAMAMIGTEAIRDAMKLVGENRPVTGEEVQVALEQLTFDKARLERLGAVGLVPEFSITCADHEGGAPFVSFNGRTGPGARHRTGSKPISPLCGRWLKRQRRHTRAKKA